MSRNFYDPTPEHIAKLNGAWCGSYSGGKDSTTLVTWIEWLRRTGQIKVDNPQLVQSNTRVEDPALNALSREMMALLRKSGWECAVVEPPINQRLYNRILGIGVTPVHPGGRKMRWCTRSTKIDPMDRWRKQNSSGLTLTGVRYGESTMRDSKLKRPGCGAGGECGLPDVSATTYGPIIEWSLCKVVDWLNGHVDREVVDVMADVFILTRQLVDIYDVVVKHGGFEWNDPEVKSARYGCIGCPAIASESTPPRSVIARNGKDSPLNEIYDVWYEARRRDNRLVRIGKDGRGPIKMAVRKVLFERIMDIQRRSGVMLVAPEDEAFIRDCWERKVYPRGWSEADELTEPPSTTPLFDGSAA